MTAESEQITSIEGSVLNYRYQIDRILNDKGGMGLIYQATDLNLRGTVVLKKSRFVDDQSRSAFEREARLLYGLRHNALPRVIDYFLTEDQSQFFVMEFIPGKDLSELLSMRIERGEGPFPMEQVLDWYEQLLEALYYLHSFEPPIIHRDIKPQNLKLMPNGQIILLDFGLAKGSVGGMTLGISIQGYTPNYAPLEQMRGSGTDARSDIYSLAVTMHCLLTGQMPPDAVSRAIETLSAQPDPLRAVHDINPNIPILISDLIGRACSLNQNDRPQTASIMRDMLRRARVQATGKLPATASKRDTVAPPAAAEIKLHSTEVEAAQSPQAAVPNQPAAKPPETPSSSVGQETCVDKPVEPVAVTSHMNVAALPANPASNGANHPGNNAGNNAENAAENQFIHAFAPVKSNPPAQAQAALTPVNGAAVQTPADQRPAAEPVVSLDSRSASFKVAELKPEDRILIASDKDINPFASPELIPKPATNAPMPVPQLPIPVAAALPRNLPAESQNEMRQTSIVVIEHVDEGKALNHESDHAALARPKPVAPPVVPPVVPPVAAAPVAAKPATPPVEQRPVAPPQPAPPRNNGQYSFESHNNQSPSKLAEDSLQRARQAAELLDKPRIINNTKKEKPKEDEVKFPSVDPNLGANLSVGLNSSGLRSFTEVIGFGVRLEMHAIPGGEFMMGSLEKRGYGDEFPQHKVAISPFYIGRHPVTQKQFRAVMRINPSVYLEDSHPVESITWDEAVEFCRRLTIATGRIYRLPTEAEWEYACRSGTTTRFNFGEDEDTLNFYGWNLTNSGNHTHPVGEKKPNGWGLCDMHGNVWEWCLDWYDQMYYLQSPKANPNGPTKGTSRVLRGGSYYSLPNYCRSATRSNHQPDQRDPLVGFRVVCEARELPA